MTDLAEDIRENKLMDVETILVELVGPVIKKVLLDVWEDYRNRPQGREGVVVNPQGVPTVIPKIAGVLSPPAANYDQIEEEAPILLTGQFSAEESFAHFSQMVLEGQEKHSIILIVDIEARDIYFFQFGFDGYAISLWPGYYRIYAFIVTPDPDEVLGVDDRYFKKPIHLAGEGTFELDFVFVQHPGPAKQSQSSRSRKSPSKQYDPKFMTVNEIKAAIVKVNNVAQLLQILRKEEAWGKRVTAINAILLRIRDLDA